MAAIPTLNRQKHPLGLSHHQVNILSDFAAAGIPSFREKLQTHGLHPFKTTGTTIFQMNLGKMCNQTCVHCHVDAGPDRREIMTRTIMQDCLNALDASDIQTVDLTGGAPELNPDFRWLVHQLSKRKKHIIVRCNLTIIRSNPKFYDLPDFYKLHQVEIVSSLPYFNAARTDAQRGKGVFEESINALKMLNVAGYGHEDNKLILNLVYNPSGAFIPAAQRELEIQFKKKLMDGYGITFNRLLAITNLPVSRFLHYLIDNGKYTEYMQELARSFNPQAANEVMCRNTLSIGYDGFLYDCDFNQMLDLKINSQAHISTINWEEIENRNIILNQHCYGCTAGPGSGCGGQII